MFLLSIFAIGQTALINYNYSVVLAGSRLYGSVCLSVCLCVQYSIYMYSTDRQHNLSLCPSINPSIYLSICPSVPYGLLTREQKRRRKTIIYVNIIYGMSTFQLTGYYTLAIGHQNFKKMTHISR